MNLCRIRKTGTALASLLVLCLLVATPFVLATHDHSAPNKCELCILAIAALVATAPPCSSPLRDDPCECLRPENDAIVALDVSVDRPARAPPAA